MATGNIVGQFHGLAEGQDGKFKDIGRSSDYLTVVPYDAQNLYRKGNRNSRSGKAHTMKRWRGGRQQRMPTTRSTAGG
jgi:hypothetical protein